MGALLGLINPIAQIIDKVLPDKTANDAAKANLLQLQISGEIQASLDQIDVDKTEAQSKSVFVAGWRPAVGWACVAIFVYNYILQPFLVFLLVIFKPSFEVTKLPVLDITTMMPVLLGILGLGAARTVEKVNGINAGH